MALVALAACGSGASGGGKSGPVEVVTHNAVGGGSDVFTRQMIKVMYENKIIDTNWPVRNVPGRRLDRRDVVHGRPKGQRRA